MESPNLLFKKIYINEFSITLRLLISAGYSKHTACETEDTPTIFFTYHLDTAILFSDTAFSISTAIALMYAPST